MRNRTLSVIAQAFVAFLSVSLGSGPLVLAQEISPGALIAQCSETGTGATARGTYGVRISSQESSEELTASLFRVGLFAPTLLGQYQVQATHGGMQLSFRGEDFSLEIALESFVATQEHMGFLTVKIPGKGEIRANLVCRLNQQP